MSSVFKEEYKKLNSAQKDAVNSLEGPIMVVAGPGTGKTQVLALRIANILEKTDIKVDGILCLTFTNSGVEAMKDRLRCYIGEAGNEVNVFTFHGFGMKIIGEHYKVLGLNEAPELLEDTDRAIFFDQIINENDWQHLRPRGNNMRYFQDLKSLISLLKRERISIEDFEAGIEKEINYLERDESSRSTRGASKGQLKKEALNAIDGLKRSREIIKFLRLYEDTKKERNLMDYDDVLESLVYIVENSDDAVSSVRERYLYVLIDEHQDSSRVQNEFLTRVWASVERPDIFVVGDDRQLIYGFSGASIEYFAGFKKTFPDAKLITLTDNYRSTQVILDASHALLESVLTKDKLVSQNKEKHPIELVDTETPEEEIVAAAQDIKLKISAKGGSASGGEKSLNPNDIAILVPKNRQVRTAMEILHNEGVPVGGLEALSLFDQDETLALMRVLKVINNGDVASLAMSFFDKTSGITPLEAHQFISKENMRQFSIEKISGKSLTLFPSDNNAEKWIAKLLKWKSDFENNNMQKDLKSLIQMVGKELLEGKEIEKKLVSGKIILDTVTDLFSKQEEKNPDITIGWFLEYLERLVSSNEYIPLLAPSGEGVKVLTMHSSKGLEFDYVWIAHMDEKSLSGGRRMGLTLPESIAEKVEERDIDAIKRKLYVAITRAKKFCRLSYSRESVKGSEQELAKIIAELPSEVFEKVSISAGKKRIIKNTNLPKLLKLVADKYKDRYVSVSLLNNFFECPWKWYFENLLQMPKDKIEVLEFGIVVHASIDRILKMKDIPSEEKVEDIVTEEVLRREFGDARGRVRMGREIINIVSSWVENRLPEIKLSRKTEESITVNNSDYPHLKIYGKIDLIENLTGKEAREVRVTDFKTGSVRRKSEVEKLDEEGRMSGNLRQLAMYSYLLRENPKWRVDARESRLEFLEEKDFDKRIYNTVITVREIELLKKDIKDYDELVKSEDWINRECHYNSYGRGTECEYCQLAEIYK
ncbi:MAG: ATP-dependent DNA helicase [Candidatus Paceibacterota bacterium]